jgi:hypothetical protein
VADPEPASQVQTPATPLVLIVNHLGVSSCHFFPQVVTILTMPDCTPCTVLCSELTALKTELGVKDEELMILRNSQKECGRMAAEIVDLHTLAEEQRRHMAMVSSKQLDPDVGIYTWLKQQSERHTLALNECRAQKEQEMYALRAAHVYEVSQLTQQVQALTCHNEYWTEQHRQIVELLQSSNERLHVLEATVHEQRRQLSSGTVDVDVGLLPLVKKGYLEANSDVQAYIDAAVTRRVGEQTSALAAEVSALKLSLADAREEVEKVKAEVEQAKEAEAKACADSLAYVSQLRRVTDVSNEWKRKYEEARNELEGVTAALAEHKEMEEYAQKLADLVAEKEEWLVEKEKLTKLSSAYLTSIRHWQGEAKRMTDELVVALSSRDAFQLRLYTVSAEKQALEDEKERVTAIMQNQKKACEFVADVGQLWSAYCGIQRPVPVNPLEDVEGEAQEEEANKGKKGKKSRGKK